jgi:hypothetical protein
MYKALYLSPMIPSFNVTETTTFFRDVLFFTVTRGDSHYAILQKDNLTIHILKAGSDIGQMEFYLEVSDIDQLWESVKAKLEGVNVRSPFDQPYGMREVHIAIPHTNTLLFIGQEIKAEQS